ncbi:hypothetical protein LIPSTDRAFT_68822 [Lipomyces starkeyi NRRL Y-11557]|uniref:Uncharacterized protein n=1 Tax=Lipomyces starkeyi NRRL Y-11557 TaxID=675824 RepID=A0A1E3QAJ4_LIPST|nr:hypothetical protein LIPSTDRAFT_68822 [Lipomyces starkeyi NRRL Y-11557]
MDYEIRLIGMQISAIHHPPLQDWQWIFTENQPFTLASFRQIFHDIPGTTIPFSSRHTLRHRLVDNFTSQRLLKEELYRKCCTIALSLGMWTRESYPDTGNHWTLAYRRLPISRESIRL